MLTVRADCSFFTRKPAHSSHLLPVLAAVRFSLWNPFRYPTFPENPDVILLPRSEVSRLVMNAQLVYREIKEQGYTGSDQPIVRFFAQFRTKKDARKFKQADPSQEIPSKRPPTASQVAHWMTFKEEQRLDWQQKYLTQLCEADPQIAQTYELIQSFTTMLRERQGERLDAWLIQVEVQGVPEIKSFAQRLKRDYDAVKAGLTLPWSQGPVSKWRECSTVFKVNGRKSARNIGIDYPKPKKAASQAEAWAPFL